MYTLNEIWDHRVIQDHIMNSFNSVVNVNPLIANIELAEAISIETLIYQYTHVLRSQYVKSTEENKPLVINLVNDIISHNILQLVVECRMLRDNIDYKNIGKSHTQVSVNPYNNSQDPNKPNIMGDTIQYSELNNMMNSINFLKLNSVYIKEIYKELQTIVSMIYEGK